MNLEDVQRKEEEIKKRPKTDLHGVLAISNVELATLYGKENLQKNEELARVLFGKVFDEITKVDLHDLTEEILRSLFLVRKNMPDNFPEILNFVIWHKNLDFLDRINISQGLKLFDFDLEQINAFKPLAQAPVLFDVAQLTAVDLKNSDKSLASHKH